MSPAALECLVVGCLETIPSAHVGSPVAHRGALVDGSICKIFVRTAFVRTHISRVGFISDMRRSKVGHKRSWIEWIFVPSYSVQQYVFVHHMVDEFLILVDLNPVPSGKPLLSSFPGLSAMAIYITKYAQRKQTTAKGVSLQMFEPWLARFGVHAANSQSVQDPYDTLRGPLPVYTRTDLIAVDKQATEIRCCCPSVKSRAMCILQGPVYILGHRGQDKDYSAPLKMRVKVHVVQSGHCAKRHETAIGALHERHRDQASYLDAWVQTPQVTRFLLFLQFSRKLSLSAARCYLCDTISFCFGPGESRRSWILSWQYNEQSCRVVFAILWTDPMTSLSTQRPFLMPGVQCS
ncbi:hypothetical protein KCU87_g496, partial [Aureobasidium melanogenum]